MSQFIDNNQPRITSLAALSGLRAEHLTTRREVAGAERRAGVEWNGTAHVKAGVPRATRSARGTWGRQCGARVYALTAAECAAEGKTPGPGNF